MEYDPAFPTDEIEDKSDCLDIGAIPLPGGLVQNCVDSSINNLVCNIPLPPDNIVPNSSLSFNNIIPPPPPLPLANGSEIVNDGTTKSDSPLLSFRIKSVNKRSRPGTLRTGVLPTKPKHPEIESKTELFKPTREDELEIMAELQNGGIVDRQNLSNPLNSVTETLNAQMNNASQASESGLASKFSKIEPVKSDQEHSTKPFSSNSEKVLPCEDDKTVDHKRRSRSRSKVRVDSNKVRSSKQPSSLEKRKSRSRSPQKSHSNRRSSKSRRSKSPDNCRRGSPTHSSHRRPRSRSLKRRSRSRSLRRSKSRSRRRRSPSRSHRRRSPSRSFRRGRPSSPVKRNRSRSYLRKGHQSRSVSSKRDRNSNSSRTKRLRLEQKNTCPSSRRQSKISTEVETKPIEKELCKSSGNHKDDKTTSDKKIGKPKESDKSGKLASGKKPRRSSKNSEKSGKTDTKRSSISNSKTSKDKDKETTRKSESKVHESKTSKSAPDNKSAASSKGSTTSKSKSVRKEAKIDCVKPKKDREKKHQSSSYDCIDSKVTDSPLQKKADTTS
ncbi:unnamed protein product [Rodentolepis nana]|uniref:SRRM_C domain-containing protein n=1 Tax=Rodentolepis nana TaxID=102285 RepID=A0A0R3TD04_RODNA|nr:unnamed protein product [Rodentolepis nana]